MADERPHTDTAERPAVAARPGGPTPAWVAWLLVAATLVAVAVVGAWLVVRPPGDDSTASDAGSAGSEASTDGQSDDDPTADPTGESSALPADAVDLTATATPTVPRAAPANNDVTGELVTFVAANLTDADPTTCWRMAGDGTGATVSFTFAEPVTLTSVGIVNGYAKTSVDSSGRSFDWYHGNRRLLQAAWVLQGEVFEQELGDTTELQTIEIEPTETTTVELRLIEVSPPGPAPIGRDYTALSDVAFTGVPG